MKPIVNVEDMRRKASKALPRILFDFVEGGADDELTLTANRQSLRQIDLRPRNGVYVADPNLRTRLFDDELALPLLLAPVGGLSLLHPHGQAGAVRAARSAGTHAVVGTLSGSSLEDVASVSGQPGEWFQLYNLGGRVGAKRLVQRAADAGYRVLVVTVDTPAAGHRERDIRNGGVHPGGMPVQQVTLANMVRFAPKVLGRPRWAYRFVRSGFAMGQPNFAQLAADGGPVSPEDAQSLWASEPVTWQDFEWIRAMWPGPIVAKGLLTDADARTAVDVGADGVVISNHGGRQLDGSPATIDMLPQVVSAVGNEASILIDGGFRRGADIVRALALGASAVLIGRPYLYGLAVGGETGVSAVLEIFRTEIRRTLQLLGCPSVRDLDPSWLELSNVKS